MNLGMNSFSINSAVTCANNKMKRHYMSFINHATNKQPLNMLPINIYHILDNYATPYNKCVYQSKF